MDERNLQNTLEAMSKSELVTYANMTFGLNVNSRLSKNDLIHAVTTASRKFAGSTKLLMQEHEGLPPGYARIKINKTELNKSGRPAILGLNGVHYSLPVGVEIQVPLPLVEILEHAVRYEYEPDPANDNELVRKEVHSYPFSVLEISPVLPKYIEEDYEEEDEEETLEA